MKKEYIKSSISFIEAEETLLNTPICVDFSTKDDDFVIEWE